MSLNMTVYVLIPVHHNIDYTLDCIEALKRQAYKPIEIVVVDDGSKDGTASVIKERYPDVVLLSGDGNLWWAGSMQLGVNHIMSKAKDGDFILSLNNDVIFDEDYLSILVETSLAHGRALTGSFCKEHDTDKIIDQGGCFVWEEARDISTQRLLMHRSDSSDVLEGLDYLFGRGTLIPLEVFQRIGNFNGKALAHYGADTEFTYRAKRGGFNLILSLKACIYNYESKKTTGVHYSEKNIMSLSQAWQALTSVKSAYNLRKITTFVNLCCPQEFRFRNKVKRTTMVLLEFLGRTVLLYVPLKGFHALKAFIRGLRYLKFIFIRFPIPETEFRKKDLKIDYFLNNKILIKLHFMRQPFYKVIVPPQRISDENGGRDLKELSELSSRFTKKFQWFWKGLFGRYKEE